MPLSRNTAEFTFRPLDRADVPVLRACLEVPRVRRWFFDPEAPDECIELAEDTRVRQWIVEREGRALAYLQDYDIHGWETHHLRLLPRGARGLDTFVMRESDMGQGLAVRYLSEWCEVLFSDGAPALGIDPHPDNRAAIRCYEKAGFLRHSETTTNWGPAVLMTRHPDGFVE